MAQLTIKKPTSRSDRVVVDVNNVGKTGCCDNMSVKLVVDSEYPRYLTGHINPEEWNVLVTELNEAFEAGMLPDIYTWGNCICFQCLGICCCCGIPTCCLLSKQKEAYHRGVASANECLRCWNKKFKETERPISVKTNGITMSQTDQAGSVSFEEVVKNQLWIEIEIAVMAPPQQQGIAMGMGGYAAKHATPAGVPATAEEQQQMLLQPMAQQQALLAQMAGASNRDSKLPG